MRRLVPADAPQYCAFRLRGFKDHPEAFTSSYEEESLRPLAICEQRLDAQAHSRFWGAFVDGKLVGVLGLEREARIKNRHKATVVGMFVAPEFAGLGLGRQLLQALIAHARSIGLELLVLTVTAGNAKAQQLYVRAGFQAWGVEPAAIRVDNQYYDKVHMFLSLTSKASP